ncbi:MAG: hypothetical protein HUU55_04805 [Myxococcales bacterium]|nr:hypothetical protein [Myxococcales bacterium]
MSNHQPVVFGSWATRISLLLLSLSFVYLFPYFPKINNPNENVRLYMTRAMVEDGSMALGRRDKIDGKWRDVGAAFEQWGYVNDKALVCDDPKESPPNCAGILYSAKAPGTSFLGVPVFAVLHSIGDTVDKTVAIFWLRLLCVVIPSIVFLWLFHWFLVRRGIKESVALLCTVGLGLGTMFFTYGQMFAGHQLASLTLFGAFMCVAEASSCAGARRSRWFVGAGALLATSVAMEYPTLFAAATVALYLVSVVGTKWRHWFAVLTGSVLPIFAVMSFHTVAFGRPWRTPYSSLENPHFVKDIAPGFLGLQGPTWEAFWGSFFVPYNGLFFFSPWLLLAAVGCFWWILRYLLKKNSPTNPNSVNHVMFAVSVAMICAYCVFISSHSLWRGGWTLGPRYIVGIVPPMVFVIAQWISASRPILVKHIVVMAFVFVSVVVTLCSSLVSQGFPFEFYNPLTEVVIPLIRDGYVVKNAGNLIGLTGLSSIVPFAVLVIASVFIAFFRFVGASPWPVQLSQVATALLLGIGLTRALLMPSDPWTEAKAHRETWLRGVWEPPDQSPGEQIRRRLLDLAPTDRQMSDHLTLGNMEARLGNTTAALSHYRRYDQSSDEAIKNKGAGAP